MTDNFEPFFLMDTIPVPPNELDRPQLLLERRLYTRGWPEASPDPLPYWWVE